MTLRSQTIIRNTPLLLLIMSGMVDQAQALPGKFYHQVTSDTCLSSGQSDRTTVASSHLCNASARSIFPAIASTDAMLELTADGSRAKGCSANKSGTKLSGAAGTQKIIWNSFPAPTNSNVQCTSSIPYVHPKQLNKDRPTTTVVLVFCFCFCCCWWWVVGVGYLW